jgi:hypothetical protein
MRLRRSDLVSVCQATRSRLAAKLSPLMTVTAPGPNDFNPRHLLLVKPGQYVKADGAAAVQHDDPRRQVSVASEISDTALASADSG